MKNINKVMGFDFGLKYIGVAFGQAITGTAKPLCSIKANNGEPNWDDIEQLVKTWQPDALVVGVPLNMDETTQKMTDLARNFKKKLEEKYKLEAYEVDERLSTWEAKARLKIPYKEHQKTVDKNKLKEVNAVAAAILIERWFG